MIWCVPQPKQPITIQQRLATMVKKGCNNMLLVLIQNAFDGMVRQHRRDQTAAGHSFLNE